LNINLDEATFVKLLKSNAERFGDKKAALRIKGRGIWQSSSWKTYYEQVKYLSLGLSSLGLVPAGTVAVIGSNRPETLYAVVAAQAAAGVPLCLYPDATADEVASFIERYDVTMVVAEDQEQVDKLLDVKGRLPGLTRVIYCNPRGLRRYDDDSLISYGRVIELGMQQDIALPGGFEQRIAAGKGDDTALICTTSGCTGESKGALLSYRNMLSMTISLNRIDPKREQDESVSFLPLAWFGEQMVSLVSALAVGFTVNFPEHPETVMADLREIGPHIIFSPPRVWEGIASTVQVKIMDTTPFKRFMYSTFMPIGQRVAEARLAGRPVSLLSTLLYRFAHLCLFRALRDRLGLSRVRSALTGGSALGPDVFTFFHAIGVNLKQVYGLTESAGVACMHRDGDIQGTTVGLPLEGTEIRITPQGEVLLRSDGVFKGYYKDEQATREALDDGWLHTGDAGNLDARGHLVVMDRLQNVMTRTDGSLFAPQFTENRFKFSPFIKEAVVIGKERPYLTALICFDGRIMGKWAGDNKLTYTTYSDLASKPEVYDFIEKELARMNRELPEQARIARFTLLYKDLDADDGELTRIGKVRRAVVEERYRDVVTAMYADAPHLDIDTVIDLQDGKNARIQTRIFFRTLG
jgi:long-chain acyl-CoA synthetase